MLVVLQAAVVATEEMAAVLVSVTTTHSAVVAAAVEAQPATSHQLGWQAALAAAVGSTTVRTLRLVAQASQGKATLVAQGTTAHLAAQVVVAVLAAQAVMRQRLVAMVGQVYLLRLTMFQQVVLVVAVAMGIVPLVVRHQTVVVLVRTTLLVRRVLRTKAAAAATMPMAVQV